MGMKLFSYIFPATAIALLADKPPAVKTVRNAGNANFSLGGMEVRQGAAY